MFVDATTQPGYANNIPVVELRGDSAGAGVSGLTITGASSIVQGLAINRFAGNGITISGAAAIGNTVTRNHIGTNTVGNAALPNLLDGISILNGATGNIIGGTGTDAGNVISGNTGFGVRVNVVSPAINTVQNNVIGRDATNTVQLSNGVGAVLNSGTGRTQLGGTFSELVQINAGTIATTANTTVASFEQNGGTIHVTLGTMLSLVGPSLISSGVTGGAVICEGTLRNEGLLRILGNVGIALGSTGLFRNTNIGAGTLLFANITISGTGPFDQVVNEGVMGAHAAAVVVISANLSNIGFLLVSHGTLTLSGDVRQHVGDTLTGGYWSTRDSNGTGLAGTLLITTGMDITTIGPNARIDLEGVGNFPKINSLHTVQGVLILYSNFTTVGDLTTNSGGAIELESNVPSQTLTVSGTYRQTDGFTILSGFNQPGHTLSASGGVFLDSGQFRGLGTIQGNVTNSGAILQMGDSLSAGILTINGDYTQSVNAQLYFQAHGSNASTPEFDQLIITGSAVLDGSLFLPLGNGYVPEKNDSLRIMTFGSVTGNFANYALPAQDGWRLLEPRFGPASGPFTHLDLVGTSLVVKNTNDGGPSSLRASIERANLDPGSDVILFNIPGGGFETITPLSPLPVVTEQLTIDGTSQGYFGGFTGTPLIELRGDTAGFDVNGIEFGPGSDDSKLRGFVINRFEANAVLVEASGVTIAGNYLGTDPTGLVKKSNFGNGVNLVPGVANGTIIGGPTAADRNVISGNSSNGIFSFGVTGTRIQGNYIGIDATGNTSIPNHFQGVAVLGGSDAVVGGSAPGEGNVISGGTTTPGILVEGATHTIIKGNLIGTSADGLSAVGNDVGIGGTTADERNLISGNHTGIYVAGAANADTQVLGNWIGVDVTGQTPLPNVTGIQVDAGTNMLIGGLASIAGTEAGNIFSGNTQYGILLNGGAGTIVFGNMIGLASDGNAVLGNGTGVFGNLDAHDVVIGGTNPLARNIISGNGIGLTFNKVSSGIIQGNYIGLNRDGSNAVGNGKGIELSFGAHDFIVGGDTQAAGNIISGNSGFGVVITGDTTTRNTLAGNWIGIAADGVTPIRNEDEGVEIDGGANHNTIGGFSAAAGNVISGNAGDGVGLFTGANQNVIQNNFIGTNLNGTAAIANLGSGVVLNSVTDNQVIQNTISGNAFDGVVLFGSGAHDNTIAGNLIGTDKTGRGALPNNGSGVTIVAGAKHNTIGGTTDPDRNVISGNSQSGVSIAGNGTSDNTIRGNYIGTNAAGTDQLYPNGTVGWWKADDNATNAVDSGTGTLQGGASFSDGVAYGRAFRFDGTGLVSIPDSPELDITDNITLEAWVNPSSFFGTGGSAGPVVIGKQSGYQLHLLPTGAVRFFLPGINAGANAQLDSTQTIGLNIWTHVAGTYDGVSGEWRVYINGNLAESATQVGTIASTSAPLQIGGFDDGLNQQGLFSGIIDDPAIYSRALSNADIQRIYSAQATGKGAGNAVAGVKITNGASANAIGNNVISGNGGLDFDGAGILILAANDNLVGLNKIGTDYTGTQAVGNFRQGILIDNAQGNRIGGPSDGNLISGNGLERLNNDSYGVAVQGTTASNNRVQGNFLGTDASGNTSLVNSVQAAAYGYGVYVAGNDNFVGTDNDGSDDANEGNIVGGFNLLGIYVLGNRNRIAGNSFGVGADATSSIPNNTGISISGANNLIGGSGPNDANVISGNNRNGIYVFGSAADGNLIEGNFVGLLRDGETSRGNLGTRFDGGIVIGGATDTRILRNVISGNTSSAIRIQQATSVGTIIQSNIIGTNTIGTQSRPNGGGIYVGGGPAGTVIGGANPLEGNLISGNTGDGIAVAYFQEDFSVQTWLRADGNTDESSVYRFGPFGQPATVTTIGAVGYEPGKYGEAFRFVSGDGHLESSGGVLGTTNGGATFWFKSSGTPADSVVLKVNAATPIGFTYQLRIQADGRMVLESSDGNTILRTNVTTNSVLDGQWHFIAASTASNLRLFVDGVPTGANVPIAAISNADKLVIGPSFTGAIDDLKISLNGLPSVDALDALRFAGSEPVLIQNNRIGTNAGGNQPVPNTGNGISISDEMKTNVVANTIGGNTGSGLHLTHYATGINVQGNFIGTNSSNSQLLGNGNGIVVDDRAHDIVIGGTSAATRNVISGNANSGIELGSNSYSNIVTGNYIGTNVAGTGPLANSKGILVSGIKNRIGTNGDNSSDDGERNVISGNTEYGVLVLGNDNRISGNYIGTNAGGSGSVANDTGIAIFYATGNFIGTDGSNDAFTANERNVISGNSGRGVILEGANVLAGNFIGLNASGTGRLPNGEGVQVTKTGSRVGTNADGIADEAERNIISGNTGNGISVRDPDTTQAVIAGNYIGLDPAGTSRIANGVDGISISNGANNVRIGSNGDGAFDSAERNVISGNTGNGVRVSGTSGNTSNNLIAGNYIGTDATGSLEVGNFGAGVLVESAANNNTIGGPVIADRNVISGNAIGVHITGNGTSHNTVVGNFIGADGSGLEKLPNGTGVKIADGATDNRVEGGNNDLSPSVYSLAEPSPWQVPWQVAVGDFNADGRTDLVVASIASLSILLADGNGGFVHGQTLLTHSIGGINQQTQVAVGDFNGDHVLDLVASSSDFNSSTFSNGKLLVYLGIGNGTFNSAPVANAFQNVPQFIVTRDFNRDGRLDLAVADFDAGSNDAGFSVLLGNGNGSFTFVASYHGSNGNTPFTITVEDLNRDGILDLVSDTQQSGVDKGVQPFLGNGDGTFQQLAFLAIPSISFHTFGVGVADFNGDAIPDLVVGDRSGAINYLQGTGNFSGKGASAYLPPVQYSVPIPNVGTVAVGDFNSDGNADVAVNNFFGGSFNGIAVVYGNGNGIFGDAVAYRSRGGNHIIVTDIDNDGDDDLAMTNGGENTVTVLRQVTALPNVISGNNNDGVLITGAGTSRNIIAGNYIGIGSDGSTAVANLVGIAIAGGASNNTIGGSKSSNGNVIGGNVGAGVSIVNSSGNTVDHNAIGVTAVGNAAAHAVGIHVIGSSSSNTLNDNEVRYSTGDNILVESIGSVLHRNVSADMNGLPIKLDPAGVSPGQVTVTQVVNGANPVIFGEVQARASTTYTVELFSSPTAGQASRYVTSQQVTTNALGFGSFSITPGLGNLNGFVAATLTGPGTSGLVSTSQLSNSLLGTPVIILGQRSQSPEGTPITLSAFASTNVVTGYLWAVKKDGAPYVDGLHNGGTESDGGIQFTPDNQGSYTVSLRVSLADGSLFQVGPFATKVYNLAPTVSFSYAPTTPAAGQLVMLRSSNSDPGQQDVLKNTWVVRYGSTTGPVVYSTSPSTSATTSFTPSSGGFYYVTLTVDDGDGGVQSQTRELAVSGLPAVASIVVSDRNVLEGQAVRARVPESELSRSEQLTFTWKVTKGTSTTAYPITVPSRGLVEFVPDDDGVYTIALTISDGTHSIAAQPTQITVANSNPRVQIETDTTSLQVDQQIQLHSIVNDLGSADTHTVRWSVTRNLQPFGTAGVGTSFSFIPTMAGAYVVTATATDDDRGIGKISRAFTLTEAAAEVSIIAPNGPFVEDGNYTFTANVPANVEIASYLWRARTINAVQVARSTTSSFTFSPTRGGEYQIELQAIMTDGRVANAIFAPMSVKGAAPIISQLYFLDPSRLYEGSQITVRSETIDPHASQLNYKWELRKPGATAFEEMEAVDGSPYDFRFVPTDNSNPLFHQLNGTFIGDPDNPDYEVRLTVTDSQGLAVERSISVNVQNADPLVRLTATRLPPIVPDPIHAQSTDTAITFQAITTDPGIDDVPDLRYNWIVNGGIVVNGSTSNLFTTTIDDLQRLEVQITDGDGGLTVRSFFVLQGTEQDDEVILDGLSTSGADANDQILFLALGGNDTITIASSISNRVVVLGGDGNDTIDGSDASVPVLLDGGDGDDSLTGGQYDDILIAGNGSNVLVGGNGINRFVGGGSDVMTGGIDSDYYEVHFSTVVINDLYGGNDTIDLSAAQSGVKLNLNDNAGAPQTVFSGSTLAINGFFENLIGSTHDDFFETATAGTTINAGLGNDRVVVSQTTDVKIRGGAGNDTIILENASGFIEGGDGADTITGSLAASVVTQIATGAGDDFVDIESGPEQGVAQVSVSMGSGKNTLTAKHVTGKIYATNGGTGQSIDAFGTASSAVSTISVLDSNDVGIFGTSTPGSRITVADSTNVDIFGSGMLDLKNVSGGKFTSTVFGTAVAGTTLATISDSHDIEIFGSALLNGPALNATVSGSSNVSIFGTANPSDSRLSVINSDDIGIFGIRSGNVSLSRVRTGHNLIEISDFGAVATVKLTIDDSSDVEIFGSAVPTGPGLSGTIAGSTDINIFGVAAPIGTLSVADSSHIDIFGMAAPVGTVVVSGSSNIEIFGTAAPGSTNVVVTGSQDINIFGTAIATGSIVQATVSGSSNVSIFGSAVSGTMGVSVSDSHDVAIFGSAAPNGSNLEATVQGSSNVGIFGTAKGTDALIVTGGHDIGIYGIISGDVSASGVRDLAIHSAAFGTAVARTLTVNVSDSTDVGIFGSALPSGSPLVATVSGSHDVAIFGSAMPGTIHVIGSDDIGIFGSAHTGTQIIVADSEDIGIFSGYGDQITLDGVAKASVDGGVFGVASGPGVTFIILGGSTNVGIFGTPTRDIVQLHGGAGVGLDLRGGDDTIDIDMVQHLVAITDDGSDRITVRSGSDMLFYLGAGVDRAEMLGGDQVRVIGEAGADEMILDGGSGVLLDGGDGDDKVVVLSGDGLIVRGDSGEDLVDVYGGTGISVSGGLGDDRLRIFGSLGGALAAGKIYALLDGQDGNDVLEVRPLEPAPSFVPHAVVAEQVFPVWMTIPQRISHPTITTNTSSVALIGGGGSNTICLEGSQRLYGVGGDGIDNITLAGLASNSEIAGGAGADIINVLAMGSDNRVFGDQDGDLISAYAGTRLGIFGEAGNDSIYFYDGRDGFARGGDGYDIEEILGGTRMILTGESGNDKATIRGGIGGVASGGINDDTLEIAGGAFGLLLGQSGNDSLKTSGGTQAIVSGGDGDDTIESANRGDDLYGDDGDDDYKIFAVNQSLQSLGTNATAIQLLRLRELLYVDPAEFEPASRGSDTIDLSAFSTGAILSLGIKGLVSSQSAGLQLVIANQLQLILLGSLENIIGTQGNDTLTGNSESNLLDGRGGNDSLIGLDGDDTLDGGAGNDSLDGGTGDDLYRFTTQLGNPLGLDTVYEATGGGNDGLDFSGLPTGLGTLDLNLATAQNLSGGLLNVILRRSSSLATTAEIEEVIGTDFSDTILGNDLDNRFEPRGGNDTINGRGGSDVYVFSGRNLGSDLILDATSGIGNDTLDFAGFDAPLVIDLSSTATQNLGELTLTLGSSDAIENIIGTSYDDTIYGNVRDNNIFGGAGADYLNGRAGNDRLTADLPAIVLLDFDSAYRAERGDYNYSPSERAAIELRLNAAYAPFDWLFTQSESTAREKSAEMGRSFVRLAFSQGRGGGVSGDAGEVDFRNTNRRLTSEVNINPLLPTVRDIVAEQIGLSYTATQYAQLYSSKVVALTSTIAAHELAHTAGLRHADAFGTIGSGVFQNADLSQMHPDYTGARNATETPQHIMASPASVGTTIKDAASPTYFGERESIKLAFNEIGGTRRESNRPAGTADDLGWLPQLYVPNLLPATGAANSGKVFDVSALAVVGDLKYSAVPDSTEVDVYKFKGRAGEWVNIELMAAGIRPLRGEAFDGVLKLYRANGTQLGQLLAENDDELEGTKDARLQDVLLTADGDYYVTVSRSPQPALEAKGGRYELFLSRFRALPAGSSLPPVVGDTLVGGAGADTIHGTAADDLILATDAAITDLADELYGHAGTDTLDLLGQSYNYRLPAGHSIENIIHAPSFAFVGPTSGAVSQVVTFVLTGNNTQSGTRYVVSWGDGTSSTVTANSGPLTVAHQYLNPSPASGFNVTADLVNSTNVKLFTVRVDCHFADGHRSRR